MTGPNDVPKPALALGVAGLIPFVSMAAGSFAADSGTAVLAINAGLLYGAVILSFLGGVHWGRALAGDRIEPSWRRLGWAVTPSLIAWGAAFLPDAVLALVTYVAGFSLAYFVDIRATHAGIFPAWYGTLRKILSIAVLACLLITLLGSGGIVSS